MSLKTNPRPEKSLYKPSNFTIGRYRAVAIDKDDKMLSGRKGWIFEAGPGRLGVVTLRRDGSEEIIYCDSKELDRQVLRIGLLGNAEQAAYFANNPDARHDSLAKRGPSR